MADRPVRILYMKIADDGTNIGMDEIEGTERQKAKEADPAWRRLGTPLDQRIAEWDKNMKAAGIKQVSRRSPSKLKKKKSL